MKTQDPFPNWQAVLEAPRSRFFHGHTSDTVRDRTVGGELTPNIEALFVQSNARVVVAQAASGTFRFIELPTQVYTQPNDPHGTGDLGTAPGIYYCFDVALYAGDLSFEISLDGAAAPIDLASDDRDNETTYADHFLPLTRTRVADLEVALVSLAPVAPDARSAPLAPAPLPGPAGGLYILYLRNSGKAPVSGRILLRARDMLVGRYEDASPKLRRLKRPVIDLRQETLILTRPDGAVGIHFHHGRWTNFEDPFQSERAFSLNPGEELVAETHLGIGITYRDVMPVIYALHLRPALDWVNQTAAFWRSRLGELSVGALDADREAEVSRDIYIRCLLDNFNCLQTDAEGRLIAHSQGSPPDGFAIWGIDVEPTAVSVAQVCPELTKQVLLFFMNRSRAPLGGLDHSVGILVVPLIIARQWLEVTGDTGFFGEHPEVEAALQGIIDDLVTLQASDEPLFPSRYSSDGPVGRRYDYGTNVKVWYALESYAYILRHLDRVEEARHYQRWAQDVRSAIERTMTIPGPFGPQVSGDANLGEDPGTFYLPDGVPYYDGEDTSSVLAPIYGLCDFTHGPWVNYHRFARSLWCPNYDPEFDTLRWSATDFSVLDGSAFFSRLGGSITRAEMREALQILHEVGTDDVTGSVWWWPTGLDNKRGVLRCSQGQGAWAWQYLKQWIGLQVDIPSRTLTLAPRGLLTRVDWKGLSLGPYRFDIHWSEDTSGTVVRIRNHNSETWTARVGLRPPGTGAEGLPTWQTDRIEPGTELQAAQVVSRVEGKPAMDSPNISRLEVEHFGDADGVVFARFGPASLWGHWDQGRSWDPRAMPLAVRLVVLNGSASGWTDVSVELRYPEGWMGQPRRPRYWTRPDKMVPGAARIELGSLSPMAKAVAPFWVAGPHTYDLGIGWASTTFPFHGVSQPGNGLTLRSPDVESPEETSFTGTLRAVAGDGSAVCKYLVMPIRIVPMTTGG